VSRRGLRVDSQQAQQVVLVQRRAGAKKVSAAYLADKTFSISWKTVHAEVSKSGEMGFTAGTYEDSFTGPDGKVVKEKGKYLCNWKKQKDGTWKATHDMWNTDAK
jgi:ketosteroid isomerase-like protein